MSDMIRQQRHDFSVTCVLQLIPSVVANQRG
jgi:hypothetical protein